MLRGIVLTTGSVIAEIVAALSGGTFTLRLSLQALDGKIDLSVVGADNGDFYILTFCQMLADIADIGIGHFRNMYQTGLVVGKCHKGTEIGDRFYLAL